MTLVSIGDTWELDGFTFNAGPDDRGYSLLVKTDKGWDDGRPPRPRLEPRPNGDGSYRSPNYRGSKVVELTGLARAGSRADREMLKRRLSAICPDAGTLYALSKTTPVDTLTAYVELADTPSVTSLPDGLTLAFNIQVVAPDGRRYSTALKSAQAMLAQSSVEGVVWNGPAGTTGVEWNGPAIPVTGVVYQASSGTGSIIALDNDGTTPTPVLFTIHAPATGTLPTPTITRLDTGETLAYAGTLVTGDVLTINTGTGLALLNGVPVRGTFSRFEPFEIPKDTAISVQFSAGGPADTATLLAQWSDAY
jgi:hypothetical protein